VPGLNLNDPVSVRATNILTSDGSGQKFLTLVGSIFVPTVRSALYDLGLNFKNFP